MQIKELGILATKAELKIEQDKMTKLQAFDSSHFRGKINFEDNDTQNYLVFQPMYRHSKKIGSSHHLSAWESKGLSNKSNNPPAKSDDSLAPSLNYISNKTRAKFGGSCLGQEKITFTHVKIVNIYIVYEINLWDHGYDNYPALENSLFGAVHLVKKKCIY